MPNAEAVREAVQVEVLSGFTASDIEDFQRLLPQLSDRLRLSPEELAANLSAAAASGNTCVFVVRDAEGHIQATLTGSIRHLPTGSEGWIDAVVTDEAHRGQGYSASLLDAAEAWLAAMGVSSIGLTSNPSREAARRMYASRGYELLDTGVFRKKLGGLAVAGGLAG